MKFECEKCDYKTTSRANFNRHKKSNKHKSSVEKISDDKHPTDLVADAATCKLAQLSQELQKEKYSALDILRKEKDEEINRSRDEINRLRDEIKTLYADKQKTIDHLYEENKELKTLGKLAAHTFEDAKIKINTF